MTAPNETNKVNVIDFDMSFFNIMLFMMKFAIASVPGVAMMIFAYAFIVAIFRSLNIM